MGFSNYQVCVFTLRLCTFCTHIVSHSLSLEQRSLWSTAGSVLPMFDEVDELWAASVVAPSERCSTRLRGSCAGGYQSHPSILIPKACWTTLEGLVLRRCYHAMDSANHRPSPLRHQIASRGLCLVPGDLSAKNSLLNARRTASQTVTHNTEPVRAFSGVLIIGP